MTIATPPTTAQQIAFHAYGNAAHLFTSTARELVLSGPAGTGKTRTWLEVMHYRAAKYPGSRHLLLRKTLASLKASVLVTFDERVRPQLDGVVFKGETAKRPPHYSYPNGSEIVIGGMDNPTRTLSTDYDTIYVAECTELRVGEWEFLLRPLRHGAMPFHQLGGDCNPDAPTHWLKLRANEGATLLLESRHEDNPTVTPEYLATLDSLTGVRKLRLRYGIWAAAEGMVYEGAWDRARNLMDRFYPWPKTNPRGDPPREWPRYLSVDFGYVNPTVVQWWAEDPDGRLYRYRELYVTKRLVSDIAAQVKAVSRWGEPAERGGDVLPRAIICDHDAENRAQFERVLGLMTTPANKSVKAGIDATAEMLRPAGDGRPRLYFLRDSLVERDRELGDAARPTCTEDEIEGYVWDTRAGQKRGDVPVKENDHGMDAMRYMVAHRALRPTTARFGGKIW